MDTSGKQQGTKSVSWTERRCSNFTEPNLGDVLELRVLQPVPHGHQTENHVGSIIHLDERQRRKDQIPAKIASKIQAPSCSCNRSRFALSLSWKVLQASSGFEQDSSATGKNLLAITDPLVERAYRSAAAGEDRIGEARLCVSERTGLHHWPLESAAE